MPNSELEKPERLIVLSWAGGWGKGLLEAVSRPFTERTGIPVHHEINIGLKLPSALTTALESGKRPPVDIVWSNAVPAIRAAERGWSEPLDEDAVPNLKGLHPRARPERFDTSWPFVSPYVVHYVLAYRTAAFPKKKPESWEALLEPRFRGKVALYPGGNGFYPIAQVMGGGTIEDIPRNMEPCWKFLDRLRPQIGRLDYSVGMGEQIRRGELDLCFRALTNALAFKEEGLDVSWAAPREGISDTTDAFWLAKNLPSNVSFWSKQYINFALSREVQERWCELLGVIPLRADASLPSIYKENSENLPQSPDDFTHVLHLPESLKARCEDEWENRFKTIFS